MTNQLRVVSIFNRLIVVILALLLIGVSALYARDPAATISLIQEYLGPLGAAGSSAVPVAIGIGVLAFVVLLFEIWPRWEPQIYESRIDGGTVEYAASVVAGVLHRDLANLDGLRGHQVEVAGSGNRVQVRIHLQPNDGSTESESSRPAGSPAGL